MHSTASRNPNNILHILDLDHPSASDLGQYFIIPSFEQLRKDTLKYISQM